MNDTYSPCSSLLIDMKESVAHLMQSLTKLIRAGSWAHAAAYSFQTAYDIFYRHPLNQT